MSKRNRVLGNFTSLSEVERINFLYREQLQRRLKHLLDKRSKHEIVSLRYKNRIKGHRIKGKLTAIKLEGIIYGKIESKRISKDTDMVISLDKSKTTRRKNKNEQK